MRRVPYYFFLMLICSIMFSGNTASAVVTTDDLLYSPPEQFLDDFFFSLTMGNSVSHETKDASLVLRRLYSFSECVQNDDYITAWQILINLPEHQDIPVISEIRNEARAIQSIVPWFSDRELKSNFIRTYNEIWLKYDNVQDDYKKFEEIFSGYSSRSDDDNPATFIRNHLSYYGYTKSASQPSSDIEYIWELFGRFSLYSDSASKLGFDTRNADPEEYGKSFMKRTARSIIDAWDEAMVAEKVRSGDDVFSEVDENETSITEEIVKPEPKQIQVVDVSKINVFKLPAEAEYAWYETDEEPDFIPMDSFVEFPDDESENIEVINPIENGEGLEPPEPITERRFPDIVNIPVVEPEEQPIEDVPILDENEPEEIKTVEPSVEEEPIESVFVNPDVVFIDNDEDEDEIEPEEIYTIPPADEPIEESNPLEENMPVDETVNDSDEIETAVNLLDRNLDENEIDSTIIQDESLEISPPIVDETESTDEQELNEITLRLTNRLYDVAEELGKNAVDMVVLWSTDPDKIDNYSDREAELENSFRVKKEEFLALLYLNDAFRFENSLGTTFDALNGRIIDSLMKGLRDFKADGGLADNPNVKEDELLRAIGQLTQGVEDRRDSLKIQTASLKAFKLRRSQLKDDITKLEQLTGIEISD